MKRLLIDVSAGIRVLQSRDGVALSEGQILERARNIVMGLVGNYRIESLDTEPCANSNGLGFESSESEEANAFANADRQSARAAV